MIDPPTIKFREIAVGTTSKWKFESINPPQWDSKIGDLGTVYEVGCHRFLFVHADTGEIISRQCTLPEPQVV